jgi:hypothetical protein
MAFNQLGTVPIKVVAEAVRRTGEWVQEDAAGTSGGSSDRAAGAFHDRLVDRPAPMVIGPLRVAWSPAWHWAYSEKARRRLEHRSMRNGMGRGERPGPHRHTPHHQYGLAGPPHRNGRIARVETQIPAVEMTGEPPIELTIHQWMETFKVPGLSVAVFDQHELVWAKSYGVKEADGSDRATVETLFQAASISKPVTAMAGTNLRRGGPPTRS